VVNALLLLLFCILITPPLQADQVDPEQKTKGDPQTEVNQQNGTEDISQLAGPNGVYQEL
jgi:hypothetical protein